eukprot:15264566-Alexandrium_andersonii.AAC.1
MSLVESEPEQSNAPLAQYEDTEVVGEAGRHGIERLHALHPGVEHSGKQHHAERAPLRNAPNFPERRPKPGREGDSVLE